VAHAVGKIISYAEVNPVHTRAWLKMNNMDFVKQQHGLGDFGLFSLKFDEIARLPSVQRSGLSRSDTAAIAYCADVGYKYLQYGTAVDCAYVTHPLRYKFALTGYGSRTELHLDHEVRLVSFGPALSQLAMLPGQGINSYIDRLVKIRKFVLDEHFRNLPDELESLSETKRMRTISQLIEKMRDELALPERLQRGRIRRLRLVDEGFRERLESIVVSPAFLNPTVMKVIRNLYCEPLFVFNVK